MSSAGAEEKPEQSQSQPAASVTSVRFWSMGNTTRVAIEVSREVKYCFEKLQEPDRLFVDISESRMKLGEKSFQIIKIGDKLVKQVRVAQKESGVTRVVLDLEGPVEQEISQLANPDRIMIEVRAPGSKSERPVVSQSRTGMEKIEEPAAQPPPAPAPEIKQPEPKPEAKVEPPKREAPAIVAAAPPTATAASPAPAPPPPLVSNDTPKPARPNTGGSRSLTRALGLKLDKVVLDPGHGGHDHGTTGPSGLTEKELVLDLAQRLGALIEQRMGSEVIYTRTTDTLIPLEERTAIANQNRADLFLSIHANSSPIRNISGAEVYYLNFTTQKDALDLAARENAGHGKSIFELRELIQKIALKDKLDESREFGMRVQASLSSTWSKMDSVAKNRGVKKAPFVVLIGASMPSVLAEIGFLSNPRDEAMLRKPDQRQRIAEALFKGVQQYAASLSQSASAARPAQE